MTVTRPTPIADPQPAIVYITVSVLVAVGDTEIVALVPLTGDHTYVPPGIDGVAVSVPLLPIHIEMLSTDTVG